MSPQRKNHKLPKVGSCYEHKYKGKVVHMEVRRIDDRLVYRVADIDYSSPSTAAKSVTGTDANGWKFWRIA